MRKKNKNNPTPSILASAIKDLFEPEIKKICISLIDEKRKPESWLDGIKKHIRDRFCQYKNESDKPKDYGRKTSQ